MMVGVCRQSEHVCLVVKAVIEPALISAISYNSDMDIKVPADELSVALDKLQELEPSVVDEEWFQVLEKAWSDGLKPMAKEYFRKRTH
ncbi:MAG: hypothetical protein V7709_02370 [Halioglobus sp.]